MCHLTFFLHNPPLIPLSALKTFESHLSGHFCGILHDWASIEIGPVSSRTSAGISGAGSASEDGDRLNARQTSSNTSATEQIANRGLKCVSSSRYSSRGLRFISLSLVPVASDHARNETSIPRPVPSMASTPARSSTAEQARVWVKTAIRNVSASGKTLRPSHRNIVALPKFRMITFSIFPPSPVVAAENPHLLIPHKIRAESQALVAIR